MLALHDAIRTGEIPNAEIVVVVSDKAEARGLALASEQLPLNDLQIITDNGGREE